MFKQILALENQRFTAFIIQIDPILTRGLACLV